jgi:hypothetical protein
MDNQNKITQLNNSEHNYITYIYQTNQFIKYYYNNTNININYQFIYGKN